MLKKIYLNFRDTITITFGERDESSKGFTTSELSRTKELLEKEGCHCELIQLNPKDIDDASILIIRKGVDFLLESKNKSANELYEELHSLNPDTKALLYGRVVNRQARYSLRICEESQEPNYDEGERRISSFKEAPLVDFIRRCLPIFLGSKVGNLIAECNFYYDITKCGISFHGDVERNQVIGVRVGAKLPLHYQWFYYGKPVFDRIKLELNNGDMYVMSEKATGYDYKRNNIYTLRHAAGCEKYLTIK